ncbi:unnamed protein product [Candida verbasci]|uniref:F-box domain-containing protein n=1 Tax=Candida verbasci TaxID=1227364 RepID=A0A9W4XDS1_9ASCO|nr:unnamed protein product [Candida verbasci]
MLTNLPIEILENIFYNLQQDEILSLSLTNSFFHKVLKQRLYSVIIIDSTPKIYQTNSDSLVEFKRLENLYKLDNRFIYGVNISTVYQLKLFFRSLNHTQNARYIKKLLIKKLPDIPDLTITELFQDYLPFMRNLNDFEWNHDNPLSVNLLRQNTELRKINGNIKTEGNPGSLYIGELVLTSSPSCSNINSSNLLKLALRNMNLTELPSISTSLKHLIIDNCNCKYKSLSSLNVPNLEIFEISIENEDCKLIKFLSNLSKLQHLKLTTNLNLDSLLTSLSKDLISLEINQPLNIQALKNLQYFKKLRYLKLQILEKDVIELLPYLSQSIVFLSIQIVELTNDNHSQNNSNCSLISQDLWYNEIKNMNKLKFLDFILEFNRKLASLNWIEFINNESNTMSKYIFEIDRNKILYRDEFDLYFNKIVNTLL